MEPFCGSAGYSTLYYDRNVLLRDASQEVCGVWDFLIRASAAEILSIPDVSESVEELSGFPQEVRWLVGFWLKKSSAAPVAKRQGWSADPQYARWFWGQHKRDRLAHQVEYIRHWKIQQGGYSDSPDVEGTWFIDPPYRGRPGTLYAHSSRQIDYDRLAHWARARQGQVLVCEQAGADWLPFRPLYSLETTAHTKTVEVVYEVE